MKNEKQIERHCSKCKREVKETVHTATTYQIDYVTRDKVIVCVDCSKKNIRSIA